MAETQKLIAANDSAVVQDKEAEAIAATTKAQEAAQTAAASGNAMLAGGPGGGKTTHIEEGDKTLNQKIEIMAEKGVDIDRLSETIIAKTSQMSKEFYGAMAGYANAQEA